VIRFNGDKFFLTNHQAFIKELAYAKQALQIIL